MITNVLSNQSFPSVKSFLSLTLNHMWLPYLA